LRQTFSELVDSEIRTYDAQARFKPRTVRVSATALGGLKLAVQQGHGSAFGERRLEHFRQDHADYIILGIPAVARLGVAQNGAAAESMPGQFVFISTSKPSICTIRGLNDYDTLRALYVRIPGPVLRQRLPTADTLCNRPAAFGRGEAM
jgi:hypothetical protein